MKFKFQIAKYGYQQMASWKIDWAEIETPFPIANAAFWVKSESEIPFIPLVSEKTPAQLPMQLSE